MPRSRSRKSSRSGNVVSTEVAALFKMGDKVNQAALVNLRRKYGDEGLLEQIRDVFVQRHSAVVRGAKRFANAVKARYSQTNTPYSIILQKARAHARKYKLSDAEFAEFQRIYEQELSGTSRAAEVVVPLTNMMRVLGHLDAANEGVNVSDADFRHLQQILNLHKESRLVHSQVVLQAISHNVEGDYIKFNGEESYLTENYDKHRHNINDHIHPVVVAMFLNKNEDFESHFIHSNISGIVKSRYERDALTTRSDYELFYDMVTDPNDIVCDHRSPLADLLHRSNLQNQLWNCVLNMRNGHIYNKSFNEFLTSVDVCRLNKYDNPDFLYGRHDGTILKRLLSAFSYRPTVVSTRPVGGTMVTSNPYYQNINPVVTKIPMITVRVGGTESAGTSLSSIISTNQSQYFIEGNVVVKREVKVIYSRGNIVVYLDRRGQQIDLENFRPASYKAVPIGSGGFEKVTTTSIDVDLMSDFGMVESAGNMFQLNSYISAKLTPVNLGAGDGDLIGANGSDQIITGSEAWVACMKTSVANDHTGNWVKYDPMEPNGDSAYERTSFNEDSLNGRSLVLFYKSSAIKENIGVKQL